MISDQILYFVIVIGVLVTVHEFGHFIAARLCGMRTDVFSIGFGKRLFGFNKRSGFTFSDTPPNKITLPIEADALAPRGADLFMAGVQDAIEHAFRAQAAGVGAEIIEYAVERSATAADAATIVATYAKSKRGATLKAEAEELRATVQSILHTHGVAARPGTPVTSFEGAGMCDYRLALLPLGGYVKIAGMVDESMDTGFASRPPQPWEFRSHPAWQRIIVISGGVAMNVVLAAVLYIGLRYHTGEEVWRTRAVGIVAPRSVAEQAGVRAGDEITAVNGTAASSWSKLYVKILDDVRTGDVRLEMMRAGTPVTVTLARNAGAVSGDSVVQKLGLYPENTAAVVIDLNEGSPASKGGLKANDVIVSAESVAVTTDWQLISMIRAHAGKPMSLQVKRADGLHAVTVTPSDSGRIGIAIANLCLGPKDTLYSFTRAFTAGIDDVAFNFTKLGGLLRDLVTGRASVKDNLGGPIAIAKMAGRTAERGMTYLFLLMASLSVSLAGLNILPVPALDGGHLVFIIVESALRREVSHKVKMAVQQIGFALLLLLMFFVVFNDLRR